MASTIERTASPARKGSAKTVHPNVRLQRLRLLAGLSPNRLGAAAKCAGKTIREAEAGLTVPHPRTQRNIVIALADALEPDQIRWALKGKDRLEVFDLWPLDEQRVAA